MLKLRKELNSLLNNKETLRTILVIEDDEGIRQLICEILKFSHNNCIPIDEGHAALEYIKQHPDLKFLIFVDLATSGMSGWEFLTRVKLLKKTTKMKLVVITGLQSQMWGNATTDADQIIQKPFTVESILNAFDEFLEEPKKTA